MFPDPNQAKIDERNALSRQIAALQREQGLTNSERGLLAIDASLISSGKPFDGRKISSELSAVQQDLDNRRVIAAGEQLEKSRKEKFLFAHPKTPPETRDAIMKGDVLVGMSGEEVVASWGEPLSRVREKGSKVAREQWLYGGSVYLYMENRKLVSFHGGR
jgi:hypothetical protein